MNETDIQTKGTTCYNLVAIAAIADWAYSIINISFVLNIAYDIYHHGHLKAARGIDNKSVSDVAQQMSVGEV